MNKKECLDKVLKDLSLIRKIYDDYKSQNYPGLSDIFVSGFLSDISVKTKFIDPGYFIEDYCAYTLKNKKLGIEIIFYSGLDGIFPDKSAQKIAVSNGNLFGLGRKTLLNFIQDSSEGEVLEFCNKVSQTYENLKDKINNYEIRRTAI